MLRTFETDQELYVKFKEICDRERCKIGSKLNEFIEDYVKKHGEGNPVYTLDKFQDPNFKAVPALMEDLKQKWIPYLQSRNDKELEDLIEQLRPLLIHVSAYRNTSSTERGNTGFASLKDAAYRAGM